MSLVKESQTNMDKLNYILIYIKKYVRCKTALIVVKLPVHCCAMWRLVGYNEQNCSTFDVLV